MNAQLLKYKHYLLLLLALVLANYMLVPLSEIQVEQQQKIDLLKKKQKKTQLLINASPKKIENTTILQKYLKSANQFLFTQPTEAEFKLSVQTTVEQLLKESACNVARIGFKGKQQILPILQHWFMEIRFEGDVMCLVNTTRALESSQPYINIEEYSYRTSAFDKTAKADFSAILKMSVWYKVPENNTKSVKG